MTDGANIELIEYQKPALEAGTYTFTANQTFEPVRGNTQTYNATSNVVVSGPRFSLDPGVVRAQYPPSGALGNYSAVFPHVALSSPTLPWERSAYAANDFEPWLVLLVIDEADVARGDVVVPSEPERLGTISAEPGFKYQYRHAAPDNNPNEMVSTVKIKRSLLTTLLPGGRSLRLQAHVRRRIEDDGSSRETAIVFSDRVPRPGASTFCFLVSVEGLYDDSGTYAFAAGSSNQMMTLVALTSWGFASYPSTGATFDELVQDISPGNLVLPAPDANDRAKAHLEVGAVPLWHEMRTADQTYSWYRGPLSPIRPAPPKPHELATELAVFADSLVTYHFGEGMFDVSNAAAFELGKAIALNDRAFTTALYEWKENSNLRALQALEHPSASELLVGAPGAPSDPVPVAESTNDHDRVRFLTDWFANLASLSPVPFNYLVPDESMLPTESLRFFSIDRLWIDSLLAGAFSVGGNLRDDVLRAELEPGMLDELAAQRLPTTLAARLAETLGVSTRSLSLTYDPATKNGTVRVKGTDYRLAKRANMVSVTDPGSRRRQFEALTGGAGTKETTGVLVRSQLVSGWPDMFIDAYSSTVPGARKNKLPPMKNVAASRRASNILMLSFDGELDMIEFYLKPDGLHFGLDVNSDGSLNKNTPDHGDRVGQWRNMDLRIVDLDKLATTIAPRLNSATFALQMFEGSSKGRFTVKSGANE